MTTKAWWTRAAHAIGVALVVASVTGCGREARPVAASVETPGLVRVDERFTEQGVGPNLELAFDERDALSVDDVRAGKLTFAPSAEAVPTRGLRAGTFWARLVIEDTRVPPKALVLEQRYAQSDLVALYEDGRPAQQSGDHVPFAAWPIRAREPAFLLPAAARHELLVALRGDMTKQLPLVLRSDEAYRDHLGEDALAQGLYFGCVVALVIYNLFLFAGTRERVYGLYVLTVASYVGSQLAIHGVGTQYLWGAWPGLNERLAVGFAVAFVFFGTPFFRSVLDLDTRRPRTARALSRLMPVIAVALVIVPLVPNHIGARLGVLMAVTWCPAMFVIAAREAMGGDRVATAVVLAWVSLLGGMTLYALRVVGVLPTNTLTVYATQFGSVLEALLLSFALADRLKRLQQEVVAQGALALANATEALAQAEVARLASEEAYAARESAMRELEERRRVQGELDVATQQLTQAENMATLGMLMAGIAHDLRNPLNYVQGAAEQLRDAIPELRSDDEARREKSISRVEKVVGWVEQGTASMDAISLAMRNQARGGGASFEAVALREVIDEALLLCRSRTKVCEVEVDVEEATVHADPTGLGQLVMNLVSNAADALTEAHAKDPRQAMAVLVRARRMGETFVVEVHDSGPGIPEPMRAKILAPFFSTKPRGQGTGLGLAIVQRVVKQHGGTLEIDTSDELGGARFQCSMAWGVP
jgi:two-component system NtrC family sensor kinase